MSETRSERTCRVSWARSVPWLEGGGQFLDPLRCAADSRPVEPAAAAVDVSAQKPHPPLRGGLEDDVRGRLAPLPRPALAVETDRVAAIAGESHDPRDGTGRTHPAALEVPRDAVHGSTGVDGL